VEFTSSKSGGIQVVKVPYEELDAGNTPEFKTMIMPHLTGAKKVVLDVSNLDFVDSSGLSAFLSCIKAVRAEGGELRIGGMSRNVRNVFELVNMYKLVEYCDTVEEAIARFKA